MKPILWFTLYELAEMGAYNRTIKVSTQFLAEKIGCSQQTASRQLIELEHARLIKRTTSAEGSLIKITELGKTELKKVYSGLRSVVEKAFPPSIVLEGEVFTGIGEGAYYVMLEGYRRQFVEKLGFDPYPGTLNLKLKTDYDLKTRSELETYPAIEIESFKDEARTFGPAKCYRVVLNNKVEGALVSAMRSHYNSSVVEIIAPTFLRQKLNLKDGNKVKVEVLISKSQ